MKIALSFLVLLYSFSARAQKNVAELSKGNAYYKSTQYQLAEAEYRKVLQGDPENVVALYNLSNTLQKQKRYDEALAVLSKAMAAAKDVKTKEAATYNQGVAHTRQKSLEASIDSYKAALRLDPGDQQARENLQKALRELKKKQEEEQNKQKSQSNMSQKEAEQKLKLLADKERQLQQRLQNQSKSKGGGQSKDW
jgi:tetratricopeptide (TPR) repeat protein